MTQGGLLDLSVNLKILHERTDNLKDYVNFKNVTTRVVSDRNSGLLACDKILTNSLTQLSCLRNLWSNNKNSSCYVVLTISTEVLVWEIYQKLIIDLSIFVFRSWLVLLSADGNIYVFLVWLKIMINWLKNAIADWAILFYMSHVVNKKDFQSLL